MENLEFIILTAIVAISFLIFIVVTVREFNKMNTTEFKERDSDGADKVMRNVGSVFDTDFDREKKY
jgi:hypothetical protein